VLNALPHSSDIFLTAVEKGFTEIVSLFLLQNEVNPTCQNNRALRGAVTLGRSEIVALLLKDTRADPSVNGNEVIQSACGRGNVGKAKKKKKN
jgi:hypothetical protein